MRTRKLAFAAVFWVSVTGLAGTACAQSATLGALDLQAGEAALAEAAPEAARQDPAIEAVAAMTVDSTVAAHAASSSISVADSSAATGRDVTFIVSPYVWIPTVSGDIDLGAQGIEFELDAGDLLDVFEFGGLIRGEMRHKSGWGAQSITSSPTWAPMSVL